MDLSKSGIAVLAAITMTLAGCSTSPVVRSMGTEAAVAAPIKTIAVMPGGLMADAVAVELGSKGFAIINAAQMPKRIRRENAAELETIEAESIATLRAQGADAVLQVRASFDRRRDPVSVTARMTSVHNNAVLAAVSWENAPDPRDARGTTGAAAEIAKALIARIRPGS